MLELDLVLVDFARTRYPRLACADQEAYRGLLAEDDWTIWEWLQRRAPPGPPLARIVELIAAFVADDAARRCDPVSRGTGGVALETDANPKP